jgi:hypothetical protein
VIFTTFLDRCLPSPECEEAAKSFETAIYVNSRTSYVSHCRSASGDFGPFGSDTRRLNSNVIQAQVCHLPWKEDMASSKKSMEPGRQDWRAVQAEWIKARERKATISAIAPSVMS